MKRSIDLNKKINFIFIMLFLIFAFSISTYYITTKGDVYSNYRIKRIEESQNQTYNFYGSTNSVNPSLISLDSVNIQAMDELDQLIQSHKIISFFIIATILSFLLLYLQIKRRNILVLQSENKIFLVHYLQRREEKVHSL